MAKIKIKSNRAAAKRFKARGNGYKYRHAFKSHILTKKTTKRRRSLRQMEQVSDADAGHISRMCPYL